MNKRTTNATLLVLAVALPLFAVGCARKSRAEIEPDTAALDSTREAETEINAPDTMQVARDTRADLEAELAAQQAHDDATSMLDELRASLDETSMLLENAPRGKGSAADLAALRGDLDAVGPAVTEIEQAILAERFIDALQMAQAAMEKTDEIRAEIERATAAQRAARSRLG